MFPIRVLAKYFSLFAEQILVAGLVVKADVVVAGYAHSQNK